MIKKLSLISLFTLLPASFYFAQTTVYAYVKDQEGKPVESAEIDLVQSADDVKADKLVIFSLLIYNLGSTRLMYRSRILKQK